MAPFFQNFHLSFQNFLKYLPAIVGAIVCILLTIVIAHFVSKIVSKYSLKRTKDALIANFIGKIVWSVLLIFGIVIALGILGLGTISDKILAGAGITTFVVGFALKDIGENFLAGLILAFSRPYKVGSFIECQSVKGVVRDMTMRQTTVEALNGKIVLIPNSMIINNPLIKYKNDENNLRDEFNINVDVAVAQQASELIIRTVEGFAEVRKEEKRKVKVVSDTLSGDKVKLIVVFWYSSDFHGSRSGTRTAIMLEVLKKLKEAGYAFSG